MGVFCKYCEKVFSSQSNINRHIRNVHKLETSAVSYHKSVWNSKCMETNCNSSFPRNEDLITHLKTQHNKYLESQDLIFASTKEFEDWKTSVEEQYKCNYIISAKRNNNKNKNKIIYYKCNRSKTNKLTMNEHQRRRNLKSQGTCKLNFTCTSQIKLVANSDGFCVHWIKTHYNHQTELEHIRLSSRMKNIMASKLISGISAQKVLEMNRDKIGEQLTRIDLLTAKDVGNIKKKFNIETKDGRKHPNDAISVDLWVKECQSKPSHENMVLFYKKQGEDCEHFKNMDFCLIIMNAFQELMLKKFGNNVIAVDSTHGLNNYDFEMSTIMIVDDFGEGVPVAFMFSNRKDTYIYQMFFKIVAERVGPISAKTFMSDLAESLYNAWYVIMGPVTYHLYCSWHVDRAWQTNLTKITSKEKRSEVYKTLKVLQSEMDEIQFKKKVVTAVNLMLDDEDTKNFGYYFQSNYLKNYEQWAYCFRKTSGINTNMRLESMHKIIKYFYLDHKKIKRLDKGLHAVLKYVKNKNIERVIKLTKGKNTVYNREIFKRHKLALDSNFSFEIKDENIWQLSNEKCQKYLIIKHASLICCKLTCSFCKICVHMYSCDCVDFAGKLTICKHIHFIRTFVDSAKLDETESQIVGNINSLFVTKTNNVDESKSISKSASVLNNIDLEEEIKSTFIKLQNLNFNNLDDEIITQIHSHLTVLHGLVDLSTTNYNITERFQDISNSAEPANKNIEQQLRFSSTKKKRKPTLTNNKKPNKKQAKDISNILIGNNPELYISTNPENDHLYFKR